MELVKTDRHLVTSSLSTELPFITANTNPMSMLELEHEHIIPVFVKDNEPAISHQDFITSVQEVAGHVFQHETILEPSVRVSHPIKGRIPEAKDKPAKELLEHEKTIYYERMAFVIEIPSISSTVEGNKLNLTIGGVKAYNLDNLYNRKGADEHFKVFIGFQNKVCCNMCIWSDGFTGTFKARGVTELMKQVFTLFSEYDLENQLSLLRQFPEYCLSESQFATFLGRTKLYQYLPLQEKKALPEFLFGENQLSMVARDYLTDQDFSRTDTGDISLWNLYNLFTGANKMSYIDTFLNRGLNASQVVKHLADSFTKNQPSWFLT
jgi:hypothetical protein